MKVYGLDFTSTPSRSKRLTLAECELDEATFCAAILNWSSAGNNRLFLTLLGGGAFGKRNEWILAAIEGAVRKCEEAPLNVAIVSYGSSRPHVQQLVRAWA